MIVAVLMIVLSGLNLCGCNLSFCAGVLFCECCPVVQHGGGECCHRRQRGGSARQVETGWGLGRPHGGHMAPAAVSGQACGGSGLAGRRLSPRGRARSPGVGELCAGHSAAGTGADR